MPMVTRTPQLSVRLLERAKDLARSEEYEFIYQVKRTLYAEGFEEVDRVLRATGVKAELRILLATHARRDNPRATNSQ
jgi:hypothetical protein